MNPTSLLLSTTTLTSDHVSAALAEQGGPAWDRTAYRLLTGVDVRSLVKGAPTAGTGTAVSVASSGWWLRSLDQLADYLAAVSGAPVLAIMEHPTANSCGYHLATPGERPTRRVWRGRTTAWAEGVALLTGGESLTEKEAAPLAGVAKAVHGDDSAGATLPAIACFRFLAAHRSEWGVLLEQRGEALTLELPWRSDVEPSSEVPLPSSMRVISLQTPVRLPGPPRWARAIRPEVISTARTVVEADGWVCLVPTSDGQPAEYGSAVRVLQFAPLADGSWVGVLHPRAAVRIDSMAEGVAQVSTVEQAAGNAAVLGAARLSLVEALRDTKQAVRWSHGEIDGSEDPASLIAHQVKLSAEECQHYLAAGDAAERAAVLADALR
jgi:hypothetical protein